MIVPHPPWFHRGRYGGYVVIGGVRVLKFEIVVVPMSTEAFDTPPSLQAMPVPPSALAELF